MLITELQVFVAVARYRNHRTCAGTLLEHFRYLVRADLINNYPV
ncbi:hypothetical protein SAMN02800694_1803 [Luteibacter sp. UNCMF331Sha3.1]|nr:hypothetical protein SAMN02800694_1803 [Luteibacter sp. UNCMF331Sha3.1]